MCTSRKFGLLAASSRFGPWKWAACALILISAAPLAFGRVAETVHNLSVTGPGPIRSPTETQICIFCHSPHNANPRAPLWNHSLSAVTNYRMYWSSTLKAYPSAGAAPQPDGASKLCLSCHDGTIALGAVGSRPTPILVTGGPTLPRTSAGYLGTDLSGSHPISIVYDDALAVARNASSVTMPLTLPSTHNDPDVKLDSRHKIQCTTCHDPHDDSNYQPGVVPHFYVKPTWSGVCETCHD
jgi:hypothetical protein